MLFFFLFFFRFTSVSGSVCVRVISTSGAFSPYAAAVGVGLWPLCAPCEDSTWRKTATQALTRGKKFTPGTFDSACLLAGLQLLPPLMSEGDANDVWMQKLKPIYLYVFIYFFCSCWECSRITLPEVNLHWSSIADIDILNTAFIHAFLIQMYVLFMYCIFMFEKWNDLCTVHGFFFWVEVFYNWFLNFLRNLKIKHFSLRI